MTLDDRDAVPVDLAGTVRPPGTDPARWAHASWYARRRLAAVLAAAAPPPPPPPRPRADACPRGHSLADAYTAPGRPGKRECRACRQARDRERAQRRSANRPDPTTTTGTDHR